MWDFLKGFLGYQRTPINEPTAPYKIEPPVQTIPVKKVYKPRKKKLAE